MKTQSAAKKTPHGITMCETNAKPHSWKGGKMSQKETTTPHSQLPSTCPCLNIQLKISISRKVSQVSLAFLSHSSDTILTCRHSCDVLFYQHYELPKGGSEAQFTHHYPPVYHPTQCLGHQWFIILWKESNVTVKQKEVLGWNAIITNYT